jgi:diguanylate cyclase (GGDEF)-like protein/PAS domain S-box-containing protein
MPTPERRVPAHDPIDRRIVDAIDDGVLVQDPRGRILVVNRSAATLLGVDQAAARGRTSGDLLWRFFDPDGEEVLQDARPGHVAARTRAPVRCVVLRARPPAGPDRWLEVSSYPLLDTDGDVEAVITTLRDVTDRRAANLRARFQADLLDRVAQAVLATDLTGTILYVNRAAEELNGAPIAVGDDIGELVAQRDPTLVPAITRAMATGQRWTGDVDGVRADGSPLPLLLAVAPVTDADGEPIGSVFVATDISERKALERAISDDRERLVEAQRAAQLGTWDYDLRTGTTAWSAELQRIVGLPPDVDVTIARYIEAVHPDDRVDVLAAWQRIVDGGDRLETTHRIVWPDGEIRWIEARAWLAEPHLVRGTLLDVTERTRAQEALAHQALHDPLTGLANRVLLDDRLQQAVARCERTGCHVGVFFVDLDRFKLVNEAVGHDAGDALLVTVAERLAAVVRPSDTVARFAGDEFVVVSDDLTSPAGATGVAERLLASFDEPFPVDGEELYVAASIGVAVSRPGVPAASLLRAADAAMHRAKERGRGRVELFDERLRAQASTRLSMGSELRRSLDRGELRVAYQPIVEVATGRPVGVEALVRWPRPDGATVPPVEFIPVAEDTGIIVPLGRWVLGQAVHDVVRLRASHPGLADLFVSVNLSARQLVSAELLDAIVDDLRSADLEASALHLEITESVLMDDVDQSIEALAALRSLGVELAVDDFGTGYSSLSYLKRLPLDTLKIDRSFVQGLEHDGDGSAIVDAVSSLGRALGLTILAEGVEVEQQRRCLEALGCELAQGYLWSRPVPRDEARAWLTTAVSAFV